MTRERSASRNAGVSGVGKLGRGGEQALEFALQGLRIGSAWTGRGDMRDLAVLAHNADTCGPATIGLLRETVQAIQQAGHRETELTDAVAGDLRLGDHALRGLVDDPFPHVGFGLPSIGRVRFTNVDQEELGSVPVRPVQAFQGGCPGTEGGSGVAREYQDDGALPLETGQANGVKRRRCRRVGG